MFRWIRDGFTLLSISSKRGGHVENRSIRGLWVVALLCLVAAGEPKAPAAAPPPRVNVVKSDGKLIYGVLADADHDGVTLKLLTSPEPVTIPWAQIRSVSNGLTREKAVEGWKTAHADKLCQKCHGDRVIPCPDCKGTGIDPKQQKECAKCHGTGSAGPCPTPGCIDGKINCPKPCLKLSQGVWKDKDGLKIREFRGKAGTFWWSEHHLGELIVMENGNPANKGPCPTCGGTGKIDDPVCKGKGHKDCADCHGVGVIGPACPTCDHGQVKCDECKGTGLTG
jgi:hypothetical protein